MKKIFLIIILVFLLSLLVYFYFPNKNQLKNKEVFCSQDVKLCSDGSYVSRIPPNCDFNKCPKEDLIIVENPKAGEEISSPLFISGKARGFWFFEASFPIELVDENNNLVSSTIAEAKDEWMTEEFVLFEAVLNFSNPKTDKGFLIFKKDNPSGMKEYDDEFRVPVIFSKKQLREISLYYYNPNLDKDENGNILCSKKGIVEIKRKIPISKTPIKDTIELLLKGKQNLTKKDIENGTTTEFPLEGFYLLDINLKPDGTLILNFKDDLNKSLGGSCRVNILRYQIEKTAFQFPEVKKVIFYPEGILEP
jgi:hypothetical protein